MALTVSQWLSLVVSGSQRLLLALNVFRWLVVMSKFKGGKGQTPTFPKLLKTVVGTLFPAQPPEKLQVQADVHVEMDVTTVIVVDVIQAAQ